MLNPAQRFAIGDVPGVTLHPDHESATRFYGVPSAPRVARDAHGVPQVSFLRYAPRAGASGAAGGQVMLTTDLALTEDERERIVRALVARLTPPPKPGAPPPPPPAVDLLYPEWLDGEVEAALAPGLRLTGRPSLIAANECVLQAALGAEGAAALKAAWSRGLPDAVLRYRVQVRAASTASATAEAAARRTTDGPASTSQASSSASLYAAITAAVPYALTLEGPLGLSAGELAARLQEIQF